MSSGAERRFRKYDRGAYHWRMISRNPRQHSPFVTARYQLCLELLGNVRSLRVVDLGCGDGALSGLLAKAGADVVGVDVSDQAISLAIHEFRQRGLSGHFVTSSEILPPASFDALICSDVIEHVDNPLRLFAQAAKLLKPGGIAVFSTPIRLLENPLDVEHLREFFPAEFRALCEQCFNVEEIRLAISVSMADLLLAPGRWSAAGLLKKAALVLSAWFGWNYLLKCHGSGRYFHLQIARLRKSSLPLDSRPLVSLLGSI